MERKNFFIAILSILVLILLITIASLGVWIYNRQPVDSKSVVQDDTNGNGINDDVEESNGDQVSDAPVIKDQNLIIAFDYNNSPRTLTLVDDSDELEFIVTSELMYGKEPIDIVSSSSLKSQLIFRYSEYKDPNQNGFQMGNPNDVAVKAFGDVYRIVAENGNFPAPDYLGFYYFSRVPDPNKCDRLPCFDFGFTTSPEYGTISAGVKKSTEMSDAEKAAELKVWDKLLSTYLVK